MEEEAKDLIILYNNLADKSRKRRRQHKYGTNSYEDGINDGELRILNELVTVLGKYINKHYKNSNISVEYGINKEEREE